MEGINEKLKKPNILVSNDDGIDAIGLIKLTEELKKFSNIYVSAPHRQQSAVGHSITMYYPLRVKEHFREGEFFGMAVEGTPADAVKIGILYLYKDIKFDLVVSGINHGENTSMNIIYSGTVSASTEGSALNIPGIAISLCKSKDFDLAAEISGKILREIIFNKAINLKPKTILNINIPGVPKDEIKGIKITKQGYDSYWEDYFEVRSDPSGREYYWLNGKIIIKDEGDEYDLVAVRNNYISITPLHYDLTDMKTYEEIKDCRIKI